MANPFRKSSGWSQYVSIFIVCVTMMIVDSRTAWLDGPRNILSVILSPIQWLASVPSTIGHYFTSSLTAEPDLQIAYDNLRNEYFKLKSESLLLRTLQEENQDLRALLAASERLNENITLAELMDVNLDRDNHRVSVGRGIRDGVYVGQAVIDDQGNQKLQDAPAMVSNACNSVGPSPSAAVGIQEEQQQGITIDESSPIRNRIPQSQAVSATTSIGPSPASKPSGTLDLFLGKKPPPTNHHPPSAASSQQPATISPPTVSDPPYNTPSILPRQYQSNQQPHGHIGASSTPASCPAPFSDQQIQQTLETVFRIRSFRTNQREIIRD